MSKPNPFIEQCILRIKEREAKERTIAKFAGLEIHHCYGDQGGPYLRMPEAGEGRDH